MQRRWHREEEVRKIFASCKDSGLSFRAFCARTGISLHTFRNWVYKYRLIGTRSIRSRDRQARYREAFAKYSSSGLSMRDFCAKEGLSYSTFWYMKRVLGINLRPNPRQRRPALSPVVTHPVTPVAPVAPDLIRSRPALIGYNRQVRMPHEDLCGTVVVEDESENGNDYRYFVRGLNPTTANIHRAGSRRWGGE